MNWTVSLAVADSSKLLAPIPILAGPTASGKTSVAMQLAARFPLEIISADSRQVYRHLDIGTGKPTQTEREQVTTHLIDLIEPGERYNAARFVRDASQKIGEIQNRGKLPLIVGGTGMYLKALTDGLIELDEIDLALRATLEQELETKGAELLWEELHSRDPLEAAKIHPNNHYRLLRSLEIIRSTGQTKSELQASGQFRRSDVQFTYFVLQPERSLLYAAVDARVMGMIGAGWLEEVRSLAEAGLEEAILSSAVLGYSELLAVVRGSLSLTEAVSTIQQQTRHYAKRQQTWFRHQVAGEMTPDAQSATKMLSSFFEQHPHFS